MPIKDITLQKIDKLRLRHPDKVPVVVVYKEDKKEYKFLVGQELSLGQFINIFRKRVNINQEEAIYFFTDKGILMPTSSIISVLYGQYKSNNNILELKCTKENVFG